MKEMRRIAFIGHRGRTCDVADLDLITREYPGAVWVTGEAIGFDIQVEVYAKANQITNWIIRPNYAEYGRRAPLFLNDLILKAGDIVIALWDGRKFGGTWYTLCKAREMGKEFRVLKPRI